MFGENIACGNVSSDMASGKSGRIPMGKIENEGFRLSHSINRKRLCK